MTVLSLEFPWEYEALLQRVQRSESSEAGSGLGFGLFRSELS